MPGHCNARVLRVPFCAEHVGQASRAVSIGIQQFKMCTLRPRLPAPFEGLDTRCAHCTGSARAGPHPLRRLAVAGRPAPDAAPRAGRACAARRARRPGAAGAARLGRAAGAAGRLCAWQPVRGDAAVPCVGRPKAAPPLLHTVPQDSLPACAFHGPCHPQAAGLRLASCTVADCASPAGRACLCDAAGPRRAGR